MADEDEREGSRPSFTSFWKKGKEKLKGKGITFIGQKPQQEDDGDGEGPSNKKLTAKEKAQIRRAQVRKAQIQHRQRKANYAKQLELDVSEYREMVAQTEKTIAVVSRENEEIKLRLRAAGFSFENGQQPRAKRLIGEGTPDGQDMRSQTVVQPRLSTNLEVNPGTPQTEEMFGNIDVNDLTVTLSMDETMGTPCFHISSSSSGGSVRSTAPSPYPSELGGQLSSQQKDMAINFILALEHVCWDHFSPGDFPGPYETEETHGHTLMASAYCMASAPGSVYKTRNAVVGTPASGASAAGQPPSLQWPGPDIDLDSLQGLAASLNPGDKEVTPVQALFELLNRFSAETLLIPSTLEDLKREFKGVVRCVHFGAAMERQAFESVVSRVMSGHFIEQE